MAKTLELTGGIRFYDIENDYYYTDSGLWNNDVTDIKDGEDGNRIKLSANYRPTENFAVFGIYSEGYRPGGINGSAPPVSCRNDPGCWAITAIAIHQTKLKIWKSDLKVYYSTEEFNSLVQSIR